ncbi:hypothetical protein ACFL3M_01720 [Patescibacteria group bacterium]
MLRSIWICRGGKGIGVRCERFEAYGNPIQDANFLCLFSESFRMPLMEFELKEVPDDCAYIERYMVVRRNIHACSEGKAGLCIHFERSCMTVGNKPFSCFLLDEEQSNKGRFEAKSVPEDCLHRDRHERQCFTGGQEYVLACIPKDSD